MIQRMNVDLNLGVEILVAPTIREADGLARSSRNVYLSTEERRQAPILFSALQHGRDLVQAGESRRQAVVSAMCDQIARAKYAEIDYVEVVSADSLLQTEILTGSVLLALAIQFGRARLIDNVLAFSAG